MTAPPDRGIPGEEPDGSAESIVTVAIPETREALGSHTAVPSGAWTERVADLVPHAWGGVGSGREGIVEECRGVWERWAAALLERVPYLNWTFGGFGPAEVAYTEGTSPSGDRWYRCAVALRCWAEYDGRRDAHGAEAPGPPGTPDGFTWDDRDVLIDTAHEIEHDYGGPFLPPERQHQVDTLRAIAARIAARLPPRDDPDPAAPV